MKAKALVPLGIFVGLVALLGVGPDKFQDPHE